MAGKSTKTNGTAKNGKTITRKAVGGRPSSYTPDLAETICTRIADGEPLTKICKDDDMPSYRTVLRWRVEREGFRHLYARAREDAADTLADKIQDLAERVEKGTLDYNPGRVAIDALKWIASKLKPKSYGDRTVLEHGGAIQMQPPKDHAPEWLQEAIGGLSVETAAIGGAMKVIENGQDQDDDEDEAA